MENTVIPTDWFPDRRISANTHPLLDNVFYDFDEQSERLVGHDQSYLQLTQGAFKGRFLSGFLGADVSVHIEYCNQALEQSIQATPDCFSFGVVLNAPDDFRANGQDFTTNNVAIVDHKDQIVGPAGS